jgi:hypothetical protein
MGGGFASSIYRLKDFLSSPSTEMMYQQQMITWNGTPIILFLFSLSKKKRKRKKNH